MSGQEGNPYENPAAPLFLQHHIGADGPGGDAGGERCGDAVYRPVVPGAGGGAGAGAAAGPPAGERRALDGPGGWSWWESFPSPTPG